MNQREPLSQAEKLRIYAGRRAGRTLPELAVELGCSVGCTRKWWRIGRDHGLEGLQAARKSRGRVGTLSGFDPIVVETALSLKRNHPRWGPDRVLVELKFDPQFQGRQLPGPSRLATFFKESCPECVAARKMRPLRPKRLSDPAVVHEVWQLDSQEGISLGDGQVVTICSIRDPVGGAMIASQAFEVKTTRHRRKLTWTEVRQTLRAAFTEWQTMPDSVQTDNELCLAGCPTDPFPAKLTLWLAGLGVKHRFIRPGCPTDQAQVERNHRTLANLIGDEQALSNLTSLQQALNRERRVYNHHFPSQASGCAGQPPVEAHPELLRPRRPYQPEHELALFEVQRAYNYLANFTFKRTVNAAGQVSLGRKRYSVGKPFYRESPVKSVLAQLDPDRREWVFRLERSDQELLRSPLQDLDVESLTGLTPSSGPTREPIQLAIPYF